MYLQLKIVLYFSFINLFIIAVILAIYIGILLSQNNNVLNFKDWLHARYNNKSNSNKTYSLKFIFDWYKDPYFGFGFTIFFNNKAAS